MYARGAAARTGHRGERTFGLLTEGLANPYQAALHEGFAAVMAEHGEGCVTICGGSVGRSPFDPFGHVRNILFEAASAARLAGLVVPSSLGNFVPADAFDEFLRGFDAVPIVTIGFVRESYPCVELDNEAGARELTRHLIVAHGCRRFAFVCGPERNLEAELRRGAFAEELASRGITPAEVIYVRGDFGREAGGKAVDEELGERLGRLDAIVCANDDMALGALSALEHRGIRVPYDIIVTGFDGNAESRCSIPRMTTVVQPVRDLGATAARIVRELADGRPVSSRTCLRATVDRQESCGCGLSAGSHLTGGTVPPRSLSSSWGEDPARGAVDALPREYANGMARQWVDRLLQAVGSEQQSGGGFMRVLDEVLRDLIRAGLDPFHWRRVLEVFQAELCGPESGNRPPLSSALEPLIVGGQLFIGDIAQRYQASLRLQGQREELVLRELEHALAISTDREHLVEALDQFLPRLKVARCCVALFRHEQPGQVTMVYHYGDGGGPAPDAAPGTAGELIGRLTESWHPGSLVVESLQFREESLGYLIMESSRREPELFGALGNMLGSAVKGVAVFGTLRHQAEELAVANRELRALRAQEQEFLEAIRRELDLARRIQSDFLPRELPSIAGWKPAVYFRPAQEVAGDFYDLFALGTERFGFVIADVCGKSVGAALFMALIRSLLRASAEQSPATDAATTVAYVNDYIMRNHHQTGPYLFATLFYGILDTRRGTMEYVNAGHLPPVLISKGEIRELPKPAGLALGLKQGADFGVSRIELAPGDLLLAYTDGVTEARDPEGRFLGKKELYRVLSENWSGPQQAVDAVVRRLADHAGEAPASDDVTLAALMRRV